MPWKLAKKKRENETPNNWFSLRRGSARYNARRSWYSVTYRPLQHLGLLFHPFHAVEAHCGGDTCSDNHDYSFSVSNNKNQHNNHRINHFLTWSCGISVEAKKDSAPAEGRQFVLLAISVNKLKVWGQITNTQQFFLHGGFPAKKKQTHGDNLIQKRWIEIVRNNNKNVAWRDVS